MVEKWVARIPFASFVFARLGQIIGIPANCRELLEHEEAILVFPEGVKGISKTYDHAYELQEFGIGFMRLALECNVPIVPVAVVGAEEQAPALANLRKVGELIGAPAFPVTPTFPLLGPVGLLPYPVKYHLHFGEPMTFSGDPNDEDEVLEEKVTAVKERIQALLRQGLSERGHVFW
jgi:1-acyl-sn-glycerol-3-phosphate acyltransferase